MWRWKILGRPSLCAEGKKDFGKQRTVSGLLGGLSVNVNMATVLGRSSSASFPCFYCFQHIVRILRSYLGLFGLL